MLGLTPFDWLIAALAAFRLTRLVNKDLIAESFRTLFGRGGPAWIDFATCPWCIGMWISGGVVGVSLTLWHQAQYLWAVLAISAIVGLISERS
jgi:hypothetical protein